MTTAQLLASQAIVYPDGTMQYHFRDFIIKVNDFIDGAATTSVWGGISGTLSNQTDLQSALDAASAAAEWGGITGTLSNQIDLQAELDAISATAEWGSITGTLSSQTDLQSALDASADTAVWGSITGTLASQTDLQSALDAKLESADIDTLAELNAIVADATLISDAPADGTQYARKDNAWDAVVHPAATVLSARAFDAGDSGSSTVFRAIDGGASNNTLPYSWFNSFDGGLSG